MNIVSVSDYKRVMRKALVPLTLRDVLIPLCIGMVLLIPWAVVTLVIWLLAS